MDLILAIVIIIMLAVMGIIMFNSKLNIPSKYMGLIITASAFLLIFLLLVMYNSHTECWNYINHNNVSLTIVQEKCYQYIDF